MFTTRWDEEETEAAAEARTDLWLRLVGSGLVLGSAAIPWASSRAGSTESAPRLLDLGTTRLAVLALLGLVVVTAVLDASERGGPLTEMASVGAAIVITVAPVLLLAILEAAGTWLTPDILPRTARRVAFGISPEYGIWIATFGGVLCLVGALHQGDALASRFGWVWSRLTSRCADGYAAVLLVVAVPLLWLARFWNWIELRSPLGPWSISGTSIPWFGLLTLGVLVGVTAVGASAVNRPSMGKGVVLAVLGWSVCFPAGILLAIGSRRPSLDAPGWMRDHLARVGASATEVASRTPSQGLSIDVPDHLRVQLTSGSGTLACYVAGALVVLAAWQVCRSAASAA